MKKIFEIVHDNPLFMGVTLTQLEAMLNCIQARVENYKRGDIVLFSGNPVEAVGIVLVGSVHILKEDQAGKPHILAEACTSDLFGETFACMGIKQSPVTVKAAEKSEILFINYRKIVTVCSSACTFHMKLIENMLALLAKKISFYLKSWTYFQCER